jgi:5S rRNA maturation endonuclease (ribonuclease M5)
MADPFTFKYMDLNFEDANISITSNEILSKISEHDIFKRYINNFKDINKSFCSELRDDRHPSCRIYTNECNALRYKDFSNGDHFDCWNYVMNKFNCNYFEALNIISCDFNIKNVTIDINPRILVKNDLPVKSLVKLEVECQPFNIHDFNYWNQYLITFEMLEFYNVKSAKRVFLYKDDTRYIFEYKNSSPKYAYLFNGDLKIYSPYDVSGKWMRVGNNYEFEGWDQLDESAEFVIITKSLKDVMNYRMIGINAVALPSETSKLTNSSVGMLKAKFNKIIINLDFDRQGIESTKKIVNEYGFNHFYVDDEKDLSDWIKKNKSLDGAKKMIYGKIKNWI